MTAIRLTALLILTAPLSLGCHAAGTHPHDMSAAHHEAAAAGEERAAAQHAAQYDSHARGVSKPCGDMGCSADDPNPTTGHLEAAEHARELAAKHRAASQELRDAEARSCAGIAEQDRDISPFAHGDVQTVSPLQEDAQGQAGDTVTTGATIVLRARPGLTAEWLQRVVDCHLARDAAAGYVMPEMPNCPLVPRGAQATVRSTRGGFAVDVRSDDAQTAAEILRRAERIKPASAT